LLPDRVPPPPQRLLAGLPPSQVATAIGLLAGLIAKTAATTATTTATTDSEVSRGE
jgi:hypothetical protein